MLGDEYEEGVSSVSISDEVEEYFQDHPIRRKDDPPLHLSILAKKFLAIPATSTPSERVFLVAGIVADRKWRALTPQIVDALVFLHKNSYLLEHAEKEPSVPQAELLLLPKDQEMIEISDDEETSDHDVVAIADDVDSVDEGSDVTEDDDRDVSDQQ